MSKINWDEEELIYLTLREMVAIVQIIKDLEEHPEGVTAKQEALEFLVSISAKLKVKLKELHEQ